MENITVIETQGSFAVYVHRLYENKGIVAVDYELSQSTPYHTRIESTRGTLVF